MNWKENIPLWKNLLQQPDFALVTDVDGTISPIVDIPNAAVVHPKIKPLLAELRAQLPVVAVISGRRAADVQERVDIPGLIYIGNHGLERITEDKVVIPKQVSAFQETLAAAAREVRPHLLPGMTLEDKAITLTIHYRQAPPGTPIDQDFTPFIEQLARRSGLKLFHGRKIFELRPPIEIDKGTAFTSLLEENQAQAAIYLGDDTTDAAALNAARALRSAGKCQAYAIGVLSTNTPKAVKDNADYFADGVEDVAAFFSLLLNSSKASFT